MNLYASPLFSFLPDAFQSKALSSYGQEFGSVRHASLCSPNNESNPNYAFLLTITISGDF